MNHRQVPNILFPAIVVSSAMFALLTLPFFYVQQLPATTKAVSEDLPEQVLGLDLQTILATQNRSLTIRYIGGAMVLSVMVGFGTVELRRRWGQPVASDLGQADSPDAQAGLASAVDRAPDAANHLPPEWLQSELDQPSHSANRWPIQSERMEADAAVVELTQVGEICRICVQPSQRRLFATQVAGQYYSFFQSAPNREAAWQIARQLSPTERQILITPVEQEYAIWVLQPQAERDLSQIA